MLPLKAVTKSFTSAGKYFRFIILTPQNNKRYLP
jgi:hypothetical protein